MKKLIGTMLACVMILSLAGCGKSRSDRSLTAETDTVLTTAVENDATGTEPAQTETTGVAEVNESTYPVFDTRRIRIIRF